MQTQATCTALILSLLVCGCDQAEPKTEPDRGDPTNAAQASEAVKGAQVGELKGHELEVALSLPRPGEPVYVEKAEPGPAYLGTERSGLVKVEGGKLTKVADLEGIEQIVPGPKGELFVLAKNQIVPVDGDRAGKPLPKTGKSSLSDSFDAIAVGPKGEVWATHLYGISRWDGSAWTTFDKKETFGKAGTLDSLVVDATGRVWVLEHDHIFVFEGDKWVTHTTMEDSKTSKGMYVSGGWLLGDGKMAIAATGGVLVTDGKAWHELTLDDRLSVNHFAAAGKQVHVAGYGQVSRVTLGGGPHRSFATQDKSKTPDLLGDIDAVAADAAGRTWLATSAGLAVIDAEGKVRQYVAGTTAELGSPVEAVYVRGNGPELPEVGAVQKTEVFGTVLNKTKPVANIAIEVCQSPSSLMKQGETPCNQQAWFGTATTDAEGKFRIKDVPVGYFKVIFKDSAKWTLATEWRGEGMKANEPYDLGTVRTDGMRF